MCFLLSLKMLMHPRNSQNSSQTVIVEAVIRIVSLLLLFSKLLPRTKLTCKLKHKEPEALPTYPKSSSLTLVVN